MASMVVSSASKDGGVSSETSEGRQTGNGSCGTVRVAVEGCCHGELDKIYDEIIKVNGLETAKAEKEERTARPIELLICCGDFQAVRNLTDLGTMACPDKYKRLNTFYKYYSGEKVAPVLTICIGGNHEASNYMQELPFGGWVAPNIFFLGYAGVVNFKGLRIAGLSGIYKAHDYCKPHYETFPYSPSAVRSAYHVRQIDVFKLALLPPPCRDNIDVFLSHDWPRGVALHGNTEQLLRTKPFLIDEVLKNELGSVAGEALLHDLKPRLWFSAHLHVKYAAVVKHASAHGEQNGACTKFLALDKCLPKRKFLQVIDLAPSSVGSDAPGYTDYIRYDRAWLGVLRGMREVERAVHRQGSRNPLPARDEADRRVRDAHAWVCKTLLDDDLRPHQFVQTAPPYPSTHASRLGNPQTDALMSTLGFSDRFMTIPYAGNGRQGCPNGNPTKDENEIDIDIGTDDEEDGGAVNVKTTAAEEEVRDENEIDIDL